MSRDIAAVRSEPSGLPEGLNRLLERQLAEARGRGGELDLAALLHAVSTHYDCIDDERRGVVRSMQLMSDEAQALTREIREQTASYLQAILDNVKDAIITVDQAGRIETCNPTGERIFGYAAEEILGRRLDLLLPHIDRQPGAPRAGAGAEGPGNDGPARDAAGRNDAGTDSTDRGTLVKFLERCAAKSDDTHVDLAAHQAWGVSKDGTRVAIEITVGKASLDRRDGYIVCVRDTTERHRLHRALHHQASHDALTGLINRREFDNRLTAAVAAAQADPQCRHALLYLDLDQFKVVNDTCGHPAGDQLLKQITGVLQSRLRGGDTLARLGGDEFGVLLQSCSLDQALRIAESLRQAIRDYRFFWQDAVLAVGVSIGIVEITGETSSVAGVMSAADVACYSAKDQGRNRVQLYKPDDVPERHREMQWVSKLTRACDESRFELYFQPIVPIGANRDDREHFELMLRLRDESGELVAPAEFIPAAERYDVMPSVDRWVVRQALERLVCVSGTGVKPYTVAVNLSGTSLNDERFLEYLIAELCARRLPAGAMCFEITETAAIANLGKVAYFMRELKARGCRFALDDFGSGLSSFMYLKTLPVDYLKIDGQFVENVTRDLVDRSMVEAISQVARAMGIQTIAERVESLDVLQELGRLGVGFAQGFHIARPRSTREFPHLRN